MNKQELVDTLRRERSELDTLFAQVSDEQKLIPHANGEWSVKDVIAHLMSYEQYITDRMQELLDGTPYTPAATDDALVSFLKKHGYPDFDSPLLDDDEPNAWVVQKCRSMSLQEVETQEQRVYAQLLDVMNKLPDAVMEQHNLYGRIANNTYVHYQEHIGEIHDWIDQREC